MTTQKRQFVECIGFCLLLFTIGRGTVAFAGPSAVEIRSIERVSKEARRVDVGGNALPKSAATTSSSSLSVALSVAEYRCRLTASGGGTALERTLDLWGYELVMEDKTTSRAICLSRPPRSFSLFRDAKGGNLLAWVDGFAVYIEEVSQPRKISDAIANYVSGPPEGRYLVMVGELVGREPFEGLEAIHSQMEVVSVERGEMGRLRVTVRSLKTKERFTFLFDGTDWARVPAAPASPGNMP